MTVTWTKKTGATKYMVHHKLSSSSMWVNSAELGDVNTYTITGLSHSTAYHVAVTAINSVGSAAKSSSITVTTLAPILTTGPTNLAEASKTNKQVAVTRPRSRTPLRTWFTIS